MLKIFIDFTNGDTTKVSNATLADFESIKKKLKNPLVSVICFNDTIVVKKYITRVYYTKKDEE